MAAEREASGEAGFGFPELLLAAAMGLVLAAAGAALLTVAVRTQPRDAERSARIQEGRVLVERITRELRQGQSVSGAGPFGLQILTFVDGEACGASGLGGAPYCRVTYACAAGRCTRAVANPDGSSPGPAEQVVSGLDPGEPVFGFSPSSVDPAYVGLELVYPDARGEEAVTLSDGVSLRNHLAAGADP